jgi:hypothetical protein
MGWYIDYYRSPENISSGTCKHIWFSCVKPPLDPCKTPTGEQRTFSWVLVNTFGYFSCGAMKIVKVELIRDFLGIAVTKFALRIELGLVITNWASCGKLNRSAAK